MPPAQSGSANRAREDVQLATADRVCACDWALTGCWIAVLNCPESIRGKEQQGRGDSPSRCGVGLAYGSASIPETSVGNDTIQKSKDHASEYPAIEQFASSYQTGTKGTQHPAPDS